MLFEKIVSRTPVRGGWTPDRKYRAEDADGNRYFLRIAAPERAARLSGSFRLQGLAADLGLPVASPLESGSCPEGFYTLEAWIDGIGADDALSMMDDAERYGCGLDAGRILKKLHTIPAPPELPDWALRFNEKLDRKIAAYQACPLKYEGGAFFLAGVAENRPLLEGRPQCFQHGDFHVGNFMFEGGSLRVIDFDRFGWGDPWEDFNRIPWCAAASPSFAAGMADGYFGGEIPAEFWRLLLLYICGNQLSSLPWALSFGEDQIRVMQRQAAQVLAWYPEGVIPTWYSEGLKKSAAREQQTG